MEVLLMHLLVVVEELVAYLAMQQLALLREYQALEQAPHLHLDKHQQLRELLEQVQDYLVQALPILEVQLLLVQAVDYLVVDLHLKLEVIQLLKHQDSVN